jgi:RHS repeat-associated protein
MACFKLQHYPKPELKIISPKKVLTFAKSENKERSAYLYGFNGMEKVDEISGSGNAYLTEHRPYDARLGRWLINDPEEQDLPDVSPYISMDNGPLMKADPDGDFWDVVVDVAFILYDVGEAAYEYSTTGEVSASTKAALTADAVAAIIPGVTGAGLAARSATKATQHATTSAATRTVTKTATKTATKIESHTAQKVASKAPATTGAKTQNAINKAGCFVKGTLILTNKGLIPIEQIAVGDTVWVYNDSTGDKAKQVVFNVVVRQTSRLISIYIDSAVIHTTSEHPFYIRSRWVNAENIEINDSIVLFNGRQAAIRYIEVKDTSCTVYNFAVENYHTYYVSDLSVLVHNNNPCALTPPKGPGKSDITPDKAKISRMQRRKEYRRAS